MILTLASFSSNLKDRQKDEQTGNRKVYELLRWEVEESRWCLKPLVNMSKVEAVKVSAGGGFLNADTETSDETGEGAEAEQRRVLGNRAVWRQIRAKANLILISKT